LLWKDLRYLDVDGYSAKAKSLSFSFISDNADLRINANLLNFTASLLIIGFIKWYKLGGCTLNLFCS